MNVAATVRRFLARRPWVYWLVVVALAAFVGAGVVRQSRSVEEARRRWDTVRSVVVATDDHEPGAPVTERTTRTVDLPIGAVPPSALERLSGDARARQRIAAGEIVVEVDVTLGPGPAAGADPGTLVVPVVDPLARDLPTGQLVVVAADGIVLADTAQVVAVRDDVAYVAVPPPAAPAIAAAARGDTVSLMYVP